MNTPFQIRFKWNNTPRTISVEPGAFRSEISTIYSEIPSVRSEILEFPLYRIYRNNVHLFSICPVIDEQASKKWELIEKEREQHLPTGFTDILGQWIDDFYTRQRN